MNAAQLIHDLNAETNALRAENDRLRAALERHHRPYSPLTRPCDICGADPTEAPPQPNVTSNATPTFDRTSRGAAWGDRGTTP